MRLTEHEVAAIKAAATEAFGPNAVVRLFGSRVRDDLRGGDIDLHVELDAIDDQWRGKAAFTDALFRTIDEQRVDMIFTVRGIAPKPIEKIAYRDGIVL